MQAFNVYYLASHNGGKSWTQASAQRISGCEPRSCPAYASAIGFAFPYGDYFQLAVDQQGQTQAVWGEGPNYSGPGNIWYRGVA